MTESIEALQVEVQNIKENIAEIKLDYKEIKLESKENNRLLTENINKLTSSSIQQTEILKNQERQFNIQLESVSNDISGLKSHVDSEIGSLKNEIKESNETNAKFNEVNTKWYQNFLSDNYGKFIKILIILLLLWSGIKFTVADIFKLMSGQ